MINPRGRPTVLNGQKPFIEVNAQKTRLFNVSTRINSGGGTFGSYMQVDDDESFLLDGLEQRWAAEPEITACDAMRPCATR